MTVEVSMLIAIAGCFIGLAGWLSGRDKKIANDGEWKGSINTKLDILIESNKQINGILETLSDYGTRITVLEKTMKVKE